MTDLMYLLLKVVIINQQQACLSVFFQPKQYFLLTFR